jgi:outer membrane protein TolC
MILALVSFANALTLEEAWAQTRARSEEATMVLESQRQSHVYRTQAWASLSPKVSLQGNWTLNQREIAIDFASSFPQSVLDMIEQFTGEPVDFGDPLIVQKKSYFDASVTVSQPLFNAKAIVGVAGANAVARAGDAQAEAGLAQLQVGVASAYWGVLVAREADALATDALALARKHAETAHALVQAGQATHQAELQAEIAVARAERDQLGAHSRRTKAELAFGELVGVPADGTLSKPAAHDLPFASADEAYKAAESHRPALVAAREQEKAAQAQKTAAVLAWLPTVDGRFTEAWTQNEGFSGEPNTWMLGLNASWTLWDGGYRLADNEKLASQLRQADAAVAKAEGDARVEVYGAWDELARARAAAATAGHELELAEENLRIAEASFKAGASALLDLEDARLGRDSARLAALGEAMNADLASLTVLAAAGELE